MPQQKGIGKSHWNEMMICEHYPAAGSLFWADQGPGKARKLEALPLAI
jgi:hypothetical protein